MWVKGGGERLQKGMQPTLGLLVGDRFERTPVQGEKGLRCF